MAQLQDLALRGSQVADLRPIAQLRQLGTDGAPGLDFADTPATAQDARLAELAQIKDHEQRARETLAYLGALSLSEALPLAEDLVQNPATGAFDVRPRPVVKPDLYAVNLEQVADALADVLASPNNGLNATSPVVIRLKRTLERYADDPQRIEMDFTTANASLTRQMATEDLPSSEQNLQLQTVIYQTALGIRATHADIATNRRILQEQALRELTAQDIQHFAEAAPALEAVTEGTLLAQMREDLHFLTEELPKTAPPAAPPPAPPPAPPGPPGEPPEFPPKRPSGAPRLPGVTREKDAIINGRDELTRVSGRAAQILIWLRNPSKSIDRIYGSAGFRTVDIIAKLSAFVAAIIAMFKFII